MQTDRRGFIISMSLFGVGTLSGLSACEKPLTREEVLSSLVLDLAVPDAQTLKLECESLHREVLSLTDAPRLEQLERTKQQWQRALLSFRSVQVLRTEPVVRSNALLRATFWPVRTTAVDSVLTDARAIDAPFMDELGVDVKGMFALEHLLFSKPPAELLRELSLPASERQRQLLRALSGNVLFYAKAARAALGDGKLCAHAFAKTGQDGLNELVNALITTLENTVLRLQLVADRHALGSLKLSDVEGGLSKSSLELTLLALTACQRVYLGASDRGLAALVRAVSPSVERHVHSQFAEALAAARALKLPLEQAASARPAELGRTIELVRQLEVAFKTELAGVLGVALSLVSGDGD